MDSREGGEEAVDGWDPHVQALRKLGASPVHRRAFAPVRKVLDLPPLPPWPEPDDSRADPDGVPDSPAPSRSQQVGMRASTLVTPLRA